MNMAGAHNPMLQHERRLQTLEAALNTRRGPHKHPHNHDTRYPRGELAYAQVTTSQTGIGSTETDLTGLSVTVDVPAGRLIKVTGHGRVLVSDSGSLPLGRIREDGNEVNQWLVDRASVTSHLIKSEVSARLAPAAGFHTYKMTLQVGAGTGTVDLSITATAPAFILIEDIGPA